MQGNIETSMNTISTGTKLQNSSIRTKTEQPEASNPIFRLVYAIITIGIEWAMTHLKSKAVTVNLMIGLVRVAVFILFLLLLVDVFYLFVKGKSIFEDLLDFDFNFQKKEESENDFFFNDDEGLRRQFSNLIMLRSPQGKELFQIEGSKEAPLTIEQIKASMVTAQSHVKQRGNGTGGINVFTFRKWTFYYNTAKQLLKEREDFYADGTHKIFLKDADGQAIIVEGTYLAAMNGAKEYLKKGFIEKNDCQYYRFPQAEHSNEFRQIQFGTIYEAEKLDSRTQTIIKNQYETWKS